MSAVVEVREPSGRYLAAAMPASTEPHDLLLAAPGGTARLREFIRSLAVRGRLLNQEIAGSTGLPAGWSLKRMGDLVASSEAGWSPSCPELARRDGRWGVLKVSAVSWGEFDPSANKELPAELEPRPQHEVRHGDFLLSRANTAELVAKSVVVRNPPPRLMLSDKIIRLKLRDGIDADYLNLVNNSAAARSYYQANASGTSTSMKNVSREVVLGLPVPVPPSAEQARIVARVDELMRLCDALEAKGRLEAEQHARLLDTLLGTLTDSTTPEELAANWQRVAAHFDLLLDRPEAVESLERALLRLAVRGLLVEQDPNETPPHELGVGLEVVDPPFELPRNWLWARFSQAGVIASNLVAPQMHSEDWQVAPDCIEKGTGRLLSRRTVREAGVSSANHRFYPGQLLYSKIRPSLSKVARVDFTGLCSADMYPISARIDADYLLLYMLSDDFLVQVSAAENRVKMPKLNQEALNAFRIAVPPLAEQARIVARVTELRRLCADLRQRLAAQQTVQSHLADALVEQALA